MLACIVAVACTASTEPPEPAAEPIGTVASPIHSTHAGAPPWPHVLTCYGGCADPYYDPSACNQPTSCGPIADGTWWYATERAAFYCGAKLKLERGNLCVVVDVQDNGPADWVEDNALATCGTGYIIDTSPLVADYFGGGCGWSDCFLVDVSPVPDNTPTGPAGCAVCACTAGQEESAACGNCGRSTRICQADCQWGDWSACAGEGECEALSQQTEPCCDCGERSRSCGSDCVWQPWSACAGPDPNGGQTPCDTGQPPPCDAGTLRCVDGCQTCAPNEPADSGRCEDPGGGGAGQGGAGAQGGAPPEGVPDAESAIGLTGRCSCRVAGARMRNDLPAMAPPLLLVVLAGTRRSRRRDER